MSLIRDMAYGVGAVATTPIWGWRLLRTGKWRTDWAGRFGRTAIAPDQRPTLMIHAVSVGEVNAIRQLVAMLEERHGQGLRIVVSATTDTGVARARELFEPLHAVVRYPLDFTRAVGRFLDAVRPDAVALVELEVWPTFMEQCRRRSIPVCVINGRLSERSFGRYRLIRPLIRRSFAALAAVGAQDQDYAQRFIGLGAPPDRVAATGTMKWDTAVIRDDVPGSAELAQAMGIDRRRPLVVCGSTGAGEEALLVQALGALGVQVLMAPRKPERFGQAARALGDPVRRTERPDGRAREVGGDRFLLDTLGELGKAYALATVVIVGRTFVRQGGSDMMEPAALGKATVVGPHVENFRSVAHALIAAGGLIQVDELESLTKVVRELIADPQKRRALAERGREVIISNQGATKRHVELIGSLLPGLIEQHHPRQHEDAEPKGVP